MLHELPLHRKSTTGNFSLRTLFSTALQPLMVISSRPYFPSLLIRMSCQTESKASLKSRHITSPTSLLSTRPVTLSKQEMRFVWHNLFLTNSNLFLTNSCWLFFITWLLSRCLWVVLISLWGIKPGPSWTWQLEKGVPRELMTSPKPDFLQPCQAASDSLCFNIKPTKPGHLLQ